MKHCKKIISGILTLTLFAGSVVSLSCSAEKSGRDNSSSCTTSQEEKENLERRQALAEKLKEIEKSVDSIFSTKKDIEDAFKNLRTLEDKMLKEDKKIFKKAIESTKANLIEKQRKMMDFFAGCGICACILGIVACIHNLVIISKIIHLISSV